MDKFIDHKIISELSRV